MTFESRIRAKHLILPLTLALAAPAWSQQPAASEPDEVADEEEDEEIVVTGFRASEAAAIEAKRDAFIVSDGVSADDIGRLPDQNTAAALRRIPGISVQEDQGEPRFPVIRGLPSTYNRTQINGGIVASVDNAARTVPLDIVPSTLASRLEVFKTITPDLDPNAIGGTINIVTKSAFDEEAVFLQATGAVTGYEQAGDIRGERLSFRVNGTVGTRFGPDDQFGVVLSGSYQIRDSDIPQVETAAPSYQQYTAAGAPVPLNSPLGNGRIVPIQRRLFLYNNIRERTGGALTLEWQPTPDLYLRAFGTYNRMEDDEVRHENRYEQVGNVTNQTDTTGTFVTARNIVGLGRFQINRSIYNGQFAARWDMSDELKLEFDALYSGAELDNPESTEDFRTPATAPFGFNYDFSDFFFQFNPINPANLANPANYPFSARTTLQRGSTEDVYEARASLAWQRETDDGGSVGVKGGGIYRETDRVNDQDSSNFTLPAASGLTYTLANAFERRPVRVVGGYLFDLIVDSDAANSFFEANRARFAQTTNNITPDFTVNEKIYGGFVQVSGEIGDIRAIGGIRYERTDVDSTASRVVGGVISPANRSGGYDSFLPSFHLRWNAAERLVLRAAYTNTIGRPDFSSITAAENISLAGALPTITRGNPNLKPRRSEGLDASIEYYPRGGLIALGVFYKNIDDEIFSLTTVQPLDLGLGRGLENVQISQAQNAQSATLFGVEAAIQQAFTFLPAPFDGFGVNLNATYIDSDLEVLTATGPRRRGFFLQPEWTANATLYYDKGPFGARVAYNYIGGFLETINATIREADQFWKERGQLDAQIRYRVFDNLQLFVEGENLTDAGRRELTGPNRDLLQEAAQYGRTFSAGATVTF